MGQKEKLIKRLKSHPKDFTFDEAETLLKYLSYSRSDKGKTSGSRIKFVSNTYAPILLHKPHPRKELLAYQVKQLIETLLLLFTEHSDTCCQSAKESDLGVRRLLLRSKILNEPANRYSLRGTSEL